MPRPDPPEDAGDKLDAELLQLLARQSQRLPGPILLATVFVAWLASYPGRPSLALSCWVAGVALLLVLRRRLLAALPALGALSLARRMRMATALNAMNGLAHSLGLLFFGQQALLPLAIATLLLVGLCAGSIATTVGSRPLFLAYMLPVMGGLVLRWLIAAAAPGEQPFALAIAFILALFGVVLNSLANDSFRLFCDSFAIRLQQTGLNRELRSALQQAEAASRAKTRFLASASHDLRQPIHTLSLFAASLSLRPLDPTTRDISHHIDLALESLSLQLDALLDMSKLDAGVVQAHPERFDLAALACRLARQYEPIAAVKGLQLACQAASGAFVSSDPALLSRVVGNLLDNAIKYTATGNIGLSVSVHGGLAVLAVEDHGIGIPESEQARVFEEFYQVDNPERDRSKGLGLGLSIVGRMVQLLGVRLEMVSRQGRGTAFYLMFPLTPAPEAPAAPAPPADSELAGCHCLVVDDEEGVRHGMRTLLEALGARVTLAEGETDALLVADCDKPDLLLSDFRLRGNQSGIALITKLRALRPGMPALLISGDTSPERLREARAANITLLHKPVLPHQLRQALASLAHTSQPGESP